MHVDKIEGTAAQPQGLSQGGRPVEAPQGAARKIGYLHPFHVDRAPKRNGAIARAIDIGREHMDIVAPGRQFAAERVH